MRQFECKNRFPVFKERLKKLKGDMSNTEFAAFLGMSRQTVGFYLNGERIPDILGLSQIAEKCNVSADYLIGRSEMPTLDIERRFDLDDCMVTVICREPYGHLCEHKIMVPTEIPGTYFRCCKKKMCKDFELIPKDIVTKE